MKINEDLLIGETNTSLKSVTDSIYDTGWVDLSSSLNTSKFSIREGMPPQIRRIGNTVFLRGNVIGNMGDDYPKVLDVPSGFIPTMEHLWTNNGDTCYVNTSGNLYCQRVERAYVALCTSWSIK